MKTKTFDCVEMQHRGGERVQRETQGMTLEREVAFWHQRTEELRRKRVPTSRCPGHGSEAASSETG